MLIQLHVSIAHAWLGNFLESTRNLKKLVLVFLMELKIVEF